ncbi:pentapeptide repeat-containing protein [Streptomyces sp. NPDC049915]|uniref:pentapeptide repeat-containing protein n=1 Tax=Streptomyces sp. NPDC049915 TaxID=3155510 RepID=UPI003442C185
MTQPQAQQRRGAWWYVLTVLAGVALFAGLLFLLWQAPWYLDRVQLGRLDEAPKATVVSGFRTAIAALMVASAGAVGLVFTARSLHYTRQALAHTREQDQEQLRLTQQSLALTREQHQDQANLTRDGQLNDRFGKAIELLASSRLPEQLGGIYTLEAIMKDSPDTQPTVVEVLAAFVRHHAPAPDAVYSEHREARIRPPEHVKAALIVLGRRPRRDEPFRVDLRRTDLRGAYLEFAHLEGANLGSARLEGAFLKQCQLQGAWLGDTKMDDADLEGANLKGADLKGAEMHNARNLAIDQVLAARPTGTTSLPQSFSRDKAWPKMKELMLQVDKDQVPLHPLRASADTRQMLRFDTMDDAAQAGPEVSGGASEPP